MIFSGKIRQILFNVITRNLFNSVVKDDVIKSANNGSLYIGNAVLGETELRQLIAEAKAIEGFRLWKIINESVKDDAVKIGWNNSTKMEDLNTAKTIFYTLDLQKSIINTILSKERK